MKIKPLRLRAGNTMIAGTALVIATGCTSFATVRSAEIHPGPSLNLQASATTRVGDVAGWFWAYDCTEACDHNVISPEAGFTYGWQRSGPADIALGVGIAGLEPYIDAYVQLGERRHPFGIGARVSPPFLSWREDQLYVRYDLPLSRSIRLLLNPAFFVHHGETANGQSSGSFRAFVQGIGLLIQGSNFSVTPAVAVIAGRAERNSYGQQYGPESTVFGAASIGLTLHRRRPPGND